MRERERGGGGGGDGRGGGGQREIDRERERERERATDGQLLNQTTRERENREGKKTRQLLRFVMTTQKPWYVVSVHKCTHECKLFKHLHSSTIVVLLYSDKKKERQTERGE